MEGYLRISFWGELPDGVFSLSAQHAAGNRPRSKRDPRPSDTECSTWRLKEAASRTTRRSRRSGPVEDLALSRLSEASAERQLNGWRWYTVTHHGSRRRAEAAAGAPTTNTSGPALLDADLADPPEIHDSLAAESSPQRRGGHHARGLEATRIRINIKWTSRVPKSTGSNVFDQVLWM